MTGRRYGIAGTPPAVAIRYHRLQTPSVIEYPQVFADVRPMRYATILTLVLCATTLAVEPAAAACYADYKAKRGRPLELHYGVIEIPERACNAQAAARVVQRRIRGDGWQLLNVVSVFRDGGLAKRRSSAGAFYLKY